MVPPGRTLCAGTARHPGQQERLAPAAPGGLSALVLGIALLRRGVRRGRTPVRLPMAHAAPTQATTTPMTVAVIVFPDSRMMIPTIATRTPKAQTRTCSPPMSPLSRAARLVAENSRRSAACVARNRSRVAASGPALERAPGVWWIVRPITFLQNVA